MIEQTIFKNNEEIIKSVKINYGLVIKKVKKLDRGSANLYLLNDDEYVLKEFQSKYNKNEIDKEINIINHLKQDNIPVPEYIKTVDEDYSYVLEGKVITLQKYIKGDILESNNGTLKQTLESAKYLGLIVKSLESLEIDLPKNDVSSWYSLETLNEGIEKIKSLQSKVDKNKDERIYNDLSDKLYIIEDLKNNFDFKNMDKITLKNTHGDYNLLQFIYNDKKISAIIDFVSACKMPVIWEIIRSYSYIDKKAKDGILDIENLKKYVKEFTKYVPLNKFDYEYMPYLYLVQLVTSTFGYKQYINDNSKTSLLEFAYFRTNLCRFLYANASKISKELIEIEN